MFKKPQEPLNPTTAEERWNYLVKWEKRLERNRLLCKIIQPAGAVVFTFNMLLSTINFLLAVGEKLGTTVIATAMDKIPLLPALVANLPRGSIKGSLIFGLLFSFLVPLVLSGIAFGIVMLLDMGKKEPAPELKGSEAERAQALAHKAEAVLTLRRAIPQWSIYLETTILTALVAWPVLSVCLGFLGGEDPAVLQIALSCFAMVVCIFVFFWIFAGCLWAFSQLNALYYYCPGEWTFYRLFSEADDYWESVDATEYDRRERVAARKALKRIRKKN